jgi:hypothetical protein
MVAEEESGSVDLSGEEEEAPRVGGGSTEEGSRHRGRGQEKRRRRLALSEREMRGQMEACKGWGLYRGVFCKICVGGGSKVCFGL